MCKALKLWREKHLLLADMLLAQFGAAGFVVLAFRYFTTSELAIVFDGIRSAMYSTLAAITGSLLGFILTAVSIVAAFLQMPRFNTLKETAAVDQIFAVYLSATKWLAFATVWTMIAIVADADGRTNLAVTTATVFIVVGAAVRMCRCVWALEKIIAIATAPITNSQASSQQ